MALWILILGSHCSVVGAFGRRLNASTPNETRRSKNREPMIMSSRFMWFSPTTRQNEA
jgi:hypothetical protein